MLDTVYGFLYDEARFGEKRLRGEGKQKRRGLFCSGQHQKLIYI